jgi:tRNA threonylcarbamoyladenosine biosynthesis protein TsaB
LSLILNIDTATEHASVCISENGNVLGIEKSFEQKDHASFIQPTIKKLFENIHQKISAIDAVAVTAGPGSYTGLRVGLSTAKGLCYALNKPLILLDTLEVMAQAAVKVNANVLHSKLSVLYCPMIDARRMEVFTAMYNEKIKNLMKPTALILESDSFKEYLDNRVIVFSGSGSNKFKKILSHPNAIFSPAQHTSENMVGLSEKLFSHKQFADIAYTEPFYLKEFFTQANPLYDKKF